MRCLNPFSKRSGVYYLPSCIAAFNSLEVIDEVIGTNLFRKNDFISWIRDVWELLLGDHFFHKVHCLGRKGVLDLLIFPLISRKIIVNFLRYSNFEECQFTKRVRAENNQLKLKPESSNGFNNVVAALARDIQMVRDENSRLELEIDSLRNAS